jgi:diguanylate cyclase (GGDEF)-like protein
MKPLDVRLATASAAVVYVVGAGVLGAAAAVEGWPEGRELVVLAGAALLVAALVTAFERGSRDTLAIVFAAEVAALGLVGALVAVTGGVDSGYWPLYLLAIVHVAAFQPRWRVVLACLLAIGAILAPLVYEGGDTGFLTIALSALAPTLVVAAVIHLAAEALRRERAGLAEREAEALRIAESDELTGIGNYRRFWRQLQSESARARRHDQPFSLIVLDLDGFKAINDELGHQAGDEALRRVARALEGELRTEDVLCRQGGDEFGVIGVAAGDREARELARRLVDAVAAAAGQGLSHPLSASAGWATFGEPERTPEGLLAQADRALRDAKRRRIARADEAAMPGEAAQYPGPGPPPVAPDREPAPATAPLVRAIERRRPRDARLAALSDCSRALALAEDEQAVLQIAVVHVARVLEAPLVEAWRRDGFDRPVLVARGRHAGGDGEARTGPLVEPDRLAGVLHSNHVAAMNGSLLVPISHAGRAEGVLAVHRPRRGTGAATRRLALALAAQVGRALVAAAHRAHLHGAALPELGSFARALGSRTAERVARLAVAAARHLEMDEDRVHDLRRAALLHDVGMLGVPAGLALRPAPLSEEEVHVLREHPLIGERLLRRFPQLTEAAWVLRHAHERFDGKGYPDGLAGEEIPLASRVLHAAIAYHAMVSPRPYREPLRDDEARAELRRVAGTQLDPRVVEAVLAVLEGSRAAV